MLALQLQQALQLPKHERAELAVRLLGSLEHEEERDTAPIGPDSDRQQIIEHLRAKLAARR